MSLLSNQGWVWDDFPELGREQSDHGMTSLLQKLIVTVSGIDTLLGFFVTFLEIVSYFQQSSVYGNNVGLKT